MSTALATPRSNVSPPAVVPGLACAVWATLVCGCALFRTVDAIASEVWVATDHQHPVTGARGARVIELDAPDFIKRELSAQLPRDPTRAGLVVQQRLKQGGPELQKRMAVAYQGVTDAWRLGITKIPAVIVDQRYVVYGESNVARAVAWIQDYRRTHP